MKKVFKIIFIIIVLYFGFGFLVWIYLSFTRIEEVYQLEKQYYDQQKMCYDCFKGDRQEECPPVDPASIKKTYPYAVEEIETTTRDCYWFESWENGFNLSPPEKSLWHSFEENWDYSWRGYFLWTFVILTLGQVRIG